MFFNQFKLLYEFLRVLALLKIFAKIYIFIKKSEKWIKLEIDIVFIVLSLMHLDKYIQ